MATVRPFRGIAYDHTRIPDLAAVTCPPYDVISDAGRDELYDRHPYNVVRIVSGRGEDRYAEAADFFRSWLWEGVLVRDDRPALYVYRQAFTDPSGRLRRIWGLLATVSLDDPVLAHEHTMAGPKADRLALMRAVPANLSPIYALHRSAPLPLESFAGKQPLADFVDDEGTQHALWPAYDTAFHTRVASQLAASPLLIADGHHRYAVSKQYRSERGEPGPWDDVMALLVDAADQPVCILPYHRIVRRVSADTMQVLRDRFEVEPLGDAMPDLWEEPRTGVFVALLPEGAFRIVAREVSPDDIPAGVLKRLALEPLGAASAEESLSFTPFASEVAAEVSSGRAPCGFLIQPVDVKRVWDLAASGAQMPEKSTYFFPKPRDGIVIRPLEDG